MSFQEVRTELSVCNKALAKILQQPLSGSLLDPANQSKSSARNCVLFYKSTVRSLLEAHHWGMATKLAPLVAAVTNARSSEWLYAYQRPSDMAFPVTLTPYSSSQIAYYAGLGHLLGVLSGRPLFRYEGEIIYASLAGAELEYVSYDITEADFTQTFEDLVVIFLAAQLATPVAKDRALAKDIYNEGVTKMNSAIAHSLNAQGHRYGDFVSEAELARGSAFVDRAVMGWRL
jgi:hypothetical protein